MPTLVRQITPPFSYDGIMGCHLSYCFHNPNKLRGSTFWVNWLSSFNLTENLRASETMETQMEDMRELAHALPLHYTCGKGLAFTEGWLVHRIIWTSTILCLSSFILAVVWSLKHSVEDGFSIGGYLLSFSSVLVAVVMFVSSLHT